MKRIATPRPSSLISVPIGRWAVAQSPTKLRTLLGSCVAVIIIDRIRPIGALAHVVLPEALGRPETGRYADTAIPAMIEALDRLRAGPGAGRTEAKLVGGSRMFSSYAGPDVGQLNEAAAHQLLAELRIPVVAVDTGGVFGRTVLFDPLTGSARVRGVGGSLIDL